MQPHVDIWNRGYVRWKLDDSLRKILLCKHKLALTVPIISRGYNALTRRDMCKSNIYLSVSTTARALHLDLDSINSIFTPL